MLCVDGQPMGEVMSYQAITTKYLGPTDRRGSRVKASCLAGHLTLEWDDRFNSDQNHAMAAMALAKKLDWTGNRYKFHDGVTAGGEHIFVCEHETYYTSDYEPVSTKVA